MSELLPLFVNLHGRRVLLVGGGPVAASKLAPLLAAGAEVTVVAPEVHPDIELSGVPVMRREFQPSDLDDVWLVVAAAIPSVNKAVAAAAEPRQVFVNAVDDPANASAFLSGVVRRDGVTIAISTSGDAPGLTALMRAALDDLLPAEIGDWMEESRRQRVRWKRDGIPMAERRPLLLEAINRLYGALKVEGREIRLKADPTGEIRLKPDPTIPGPTIPGHVSIVGAGPGDPALLTRAAVARLRAADLVLYDALVDDRVLSLARKSQRFFVGKRAGRHALTQTAINGVMIRAARRGRRVVRLKGGDPFVFGRGGEEALALGQAGVSFDMVPGISSAVAGPGLAGIPVTHRGVASSFIVVSGHDEAAFAESMRGLKSEGMTLVVLMGLGRRAGLAQALIAGGWSAATPAALVAEASTSRQEVWRGSLGALAAGSAVVTSDGPALFVVGQVAALDLSDAGRQPESSVGEVAGERVARSGPGGPSGDD